MDNRKPYTYYLKHLPTGLKYYGSKYGRDADPDTFWKEGGYYSSSAKVKTLIDEYGSASFTAQVRKVFLTPDEALSYEYRFIEKVGALKKADWLNENAGGKKFRNVGPMSAKALASQRSKKQTPEGNAKRSIALSGRPKTEETKRRMSIAQAQRPADKENARRQKIREKATGRKHTSQTCDVLSKKVSATAWVKRGNECIKILKSEVDAYVSAGWQRGRVVINVTCPHCGKTMDKSNASRYHFDNCKERKKL